MQEQSRRCCPVCHPFALLLGHRSGTEQGKNPPRPQELLFIAQLQQKKNLNVVECTKVWVLKERGK